jgi:hypothetical protein
MSTTGPIMNVIVNVHDSSYLIGGSSYTVYKPSVSKCYHLQDKEFTASSIVIRNPVGGEISLLSGDQGKMSIQPTNCISGNPSIPEYQIIGGCEAGCSVCKLDDPFNLGGTCKNCTTNTNTYAQPDGNCASLPCTGGKY